MPAINGKRREISKGEREKSQLIPLLDPFYCLLATDTRIRSRSGIRWEKAHSDGEGTINPTLTQTKMSHEVPHESVPTRFSVQSKFGRLHLSRGRENRR